MIENISKVVGENTEIVNTIATAVEEQSVTAKEIPRRRPDLHEHPGGQQQCLGEFRGVSSIAKEIAEVNQASAEMSGNARSVSENAARLKGLSDGFNKLVSTFKV